MDTAYLTTLSLVSAFYIHQLDEIKVSDYATLNGFGPVVVFLNSAVFWAQVYALLSSLLAIYGVIVKRRERIQIVVPSLFFGVGAVAYILEKALLTPLEYFVVWVRDADVLPSHLQAPHYTAALLPQLLTTFAFVASVFHAR